MMRRYILLLLIWSCMFPLLMAQPEPCDPDNPEMQPRCNLACIVCDVDGFTGRHDSDLQGEAPPGFAGFNGECTTTAHNIQWIAFLAGSVDLEVRLTVSNCVMDYGLELGLYRAINCSNYQRISNCFGKNGTDIRPGRSGIIKNNEPLVIGQYYYLVMDGNGGDNCDWTFEVVRGTTEIAPLTFTRPIQGVAETCPNFEQLFVTDPEVGATLFDWSVDGTVVATNSTNEFSYSFPQEGTYTLCCTAKNPCDIAEITCRDIVVASVPLTVIDTVVCQDECFQLGDMLLCDSGIYAESLKNAAGCDSVVQVSLQVLTTPILNVDPWICVDDTLHIEELSYYETGIYQARLLTEMDCDSIINIDLLVVECDMESSSQAVDAQCKNGSDGQIDFVVDQGTAPFTYEWQNLSQTLSGDGSINAASDISTLTGLTAGTYLITINDGFGNRDIIISEVEEPEGLEGMMTAKMIGDYNVSCPDASDGRIDLSVTGGTGTYSFRWGADGTEDFIDNISVGIYNVRITDENDCLLTMTKEIVAPEVMTADILSQDLTCEGPRSGSIAVQNIKGGSGKYRSSLNSGDFEDEMIYTDLLHGIYDIRIRDEQSCEVLYQDTLYQAQIPNVNLGSDVTVGLGELVSLSPKPDTVPIIEYAWESHELLDCLDCLQANFIALNSGYHSVALTSEDDCTRADSVFVAVEKLREFYAPNVFTLSSIGDNSTFDIQPGREVERVEDLQIFDRYGAKVYSRDSSMDLDMTGWDGRINGKEALPGVYFWSSKIRFIDSFEKRYFGEFVLLR